MITASDTTCNANLNEVCFPIKLCMFICCSNQLCRLNCHSSYNCFISEECYSLNTQLHTVLPPLHTVS